MGECMLYNATINVNPNEYPDEDAMVDDIMTDLEGYHPSISDSTDFPGTIDVVVAINANSPNEAIAKAEILIARTSLPKKRGARMDLTLVGHYA